MSKHEYGVRNESGPGYFLRTLRADGGERPLLAVSCTLGSESGIVIDGGDDTPILVEPHHLDALIEMLTALAARLASERGGSPPAW